MSKYRDIVRCILENKVKSGDGTIPKEGKVFFDPKNGICPNKNNCGIMNPDNEWILANEYLFGVYPSITLSDGSNLTLPMPKGRGFLIR